MGYYIPNNIPISEREGVQEIEKVNNLSEVPKDKAVIVEVDNGAFRANGLAYDQDELYVFNLPDGRNKKYFLMDKEKAHQLANYK